MNRDDDDSFDFNYDDLSPEEKERAEREMREREEERMNHPLFKKANEIFDIVSALVESFDEEGKEMHGRILMESAMMLAPKLAGAIGSDSWLICMQNAALIRYHAEYLLTSTSGIGDFVKVDASYVKVLRREMIGFRPLFAEWMKEVHAMEKDEYEDDWGLFIREK